MKDFISYGTALEKLYCASPEDFIKYVLDNYEKMDVQLEDIWFGDNEACPVVRLVMDCKTDTDNLNEKFQAEMVKRGLDKLIDFDKNSPFITLNTIPEIKSAVDQGKKVYSDTMAYKVIKGKNGDYLIKCGNHCVGLHGAEGTEWEHKLNGKNFFTTKS